ncbi:MAG: TolC family protein, partial [Aliifodinibius sp.]|nr:TolC family protein [Fodinibius sp.]NIV13329.1 TolC family protein [Fodinibius sp.]NIY27037.1 TolC family protein [Fodinibius sp.]
MKSKNSAFFISLFKVLIIISILIDSRAIAQADIETITLSKALEIAMENNPTVNASEHQLEAAQSKVWEAKSNYLPSITASAGYTLHEEPNIIVPIHERGMFPPLDEQIYETIFQLSMPLFNGGRTGANTQAAHASLTESKAQQDLVKINLLESIGQVFLQAMQLNDNQRLIRARIQSLLQRHREMKLLLKEGRVSTSDLALLNSSIEAARSDSIELDNQQLELSYRLGQLLGLKKALQPNVVNLSKEKATANRSIPDSADIAGPMVTRSIAQLNRAEALKHLASRNFWPEVRGFASYNLRSGAE